MGHMGRWDNANNDAVFRRPSFRPTSKAGTIMTSMRDQMPGCAAFIDSLRAEFGAADINAAIKAQMRAGTFYASEAGHVIGVAPVPRAMAIKAVKHACTVCGVESAMRVGPRWFCYDHYGKSK